jgi:diadenosine tetraphosphate (Ap4A) HIT family hydrolase
MTTNWKPEHWDTLINGEQCPLCELIQRAKPEDADGIRVADLRFSRLSIAKNQYVPGYCVLLCHTHVIEPYELTSDQRMLFFDDLALAGKALQAAFHADKMNYNILGNAVPHLHVHIIPRYFTDSAPQRPIDPTPQGHEVYLSAEASTERITLIQTHLHILLGS